MWVGVNQHAPRESDCNPYVNLKFNDVIHTFLCEFGDIFFLVFSLESKLLGQKYLFQRNCQFSLGPRQTKSAVAI